MANKVSKPKVEKPALPSTYREWAIARIAQRFSKQTGKEIPCSTRRLINVPKYLLPELKTKEERQYVGERELLKLRDSGLFVCTDGVWWNRTEKRKPPPEKEVQRGEPNSPYTRVCKRAPRGGAVVERPKPKAKPISKAKPSHLRVVK